MKTVTSITIGLVLVIAAPGVMASPGQKENTRPATEVAQGESLIEVISTRPDLTTFASLVKASGLEETLRKGGPYTILAPTDEAFRMLPEGMLDELTLPDKRAELSALMRYHILPGRLPASRIKTGEVATLQGSKVAINADGNMIWVGRAELVKPDINAANGVIHTITMVMEPDEQ